MSSQQSEVAEADSIVQAGVQPCTVQVGMAAPSPALICRTGEERRGRSSAPARCGDARGSPCRPLAQRQAAMPLGGSLPGWPARGSSICPRLHARASLRLGAPLAPTRSRPAGRVGTLRVGPWTARRRWGPRCHRKRHSLRLAVAVTAGEAGPASGGGRVPT
jgi:hypothetical protein